jgi:hypothetical protein
MTVLPAAHSSADQPYQGSVARRAAETVDPVGAVSDSRPMSLDELLPVWHFRERHRRATNAPAPALLVAVERLP